MPKTVDCNIKPFIGKVVFFEPLTMPMVMAIDDALLTRKDFFEQKELDGKVGYFLKPQTAWSAPDHEALKGILPCVEKWDLSGFPKDVTLETFPGSPRQASKDLIGFLLGEVLKIYNGELEIPNE